MILACILALSTTAARTDGVRLDIATRPYLDLHFYVRTLAASKDPVPELAGLAPAVEAARALDAELGGPLDWGYVEGLLGDCATAKEARAALAKARESITLRSGKTVALRAAALRLAAALEQAEPAFLEKLWPEHRRAIEEVAAQIAKGFGGKESECLAYMARSLALSPEARAIPVRLVFAQPAPGAVTHASPAGTGVCFVSVQNAKGTQLLETLLHESTHALDIATPAATPVSSGGVLDELRARLEQAGFTGKDRESRDVPHTLMFVQAGETIRRLVDPQHEHYGVVAHYYDKVRTVADIELPVWKDFLDGKCTRDDALGRIVSGVVAARKPK